MKQFRLGALAAGLLLACLLGGTAAVAQTKQIRNLKNESAALQKKLNEEEKLLRSTKRDVGTQLNNLGVLSSQIGAQQKYVDGISAEVNGLSKDISALEKELSSLEQDLNSCKRRYQRAALYMFRNRSSQAGWSFIFAAKNFKQLFRRMRYVSEYGKYQKIQAQAIRQKEEVVKQKKREIASVKQQKDQLLAEGKQQQADLQQKKTRQQAVIDDLNKRQKELQSNIAQAKKKQASLTARIDQLVQQEIAAAERRRKQEEERRKREEAERRRKQEQQRKAEAQRSQAAANAKGKGKGKSVSGKAAAADEARTAKPVFVSPSGSEAKLSGAFEANRGRLPMPITGSYAITAHFGSYNPGGLKGVTLDNKGINIMGAPGAQARCIYDGEVTAVFTLAGLYNVIVRHGSYMSVYCNLSSISVRRGQKVSARQSLGAVAKDASGNPTLHFQLRKETAKLNPEVWLGR